jgi:hypothetical protein
MDIKRKTCDIRFWGKNISHNGVNSRVPSTLQDGQAPE